MSVSSISTPGQTTVRLIKPFYTPAHFSAFQASQSLENSGILSSFLSSHIRNTDSSFKPGIDSQNINGVDEYQGQWKGNKRHGKGVCYFHNGDVYMGDWLDDLYDGEGHYIFANGERYSGHLRGGMKNGKGKFVYSNGYVYIGDWVDDVKQGQGTFEFFGLGDLYVGDFANNFREGKGRYVFHSDDVYEGNFKRNQRSGPGTLSYREGSKVAGTWAEGVLWAAGKQARSGVL